MQEQSYLRSNHSNFGRTGNDRRTGFSSELDLHICIILQCKTADFLIVFNRTDTVNLQAAFVMVINLQGM